MLFLFKSILPFGIFFMLSTISFLMETIGCKGIFGQNVKFWTQVNGNTSVGSLLTWFVHYLELDHKLIHWNMNTFNMFFYCGTAVGNGAWAWSFSTVARIIFWIWASTRSVSPINYFSHESVQHSNSGQSLGWIWIELC